jgi:dienelactone hydrolase
MSNLTCHLHTHRKIRVLVRFVHCRVALQLSEANLSAGRWGAVVGVLLFLLAACSTGPERTAASANRIGAASGGPTPAIAPLHKRCLTPAEYSAEIWFDAIDGTRLSGVVLGQGRTGVLLAHQHWFNLCSFMPLARELARAGYQVLAFDFRGFGASPPAARKVSRWLDQDVAGGIRELGRRGAEQVVLVGASMGAISSLVEAAHPRHGPELPVAGIVSLSGPARFYHMDAYAAVKRLWTPLLIVTSESDGNFTKAARLLYRLAPAHGKRLVVVPGDGHGSGLLSHGGYATRLRSMIVDFVGEQAQPPGGPRTQRTMRPSRYAAQ